MIGGSVSHHLRAPRAASAAPRRARRGGGEARLPLRPRAPARLDMARDAEGPRGRPAAPMVRMPRASGHAARPMAGHPRLALEGQAGEARFPPA
jgi:hypothetical protein